MKGNRRPWMVLLSTSFLLTGALGAQIDPPRPDCCHNIWMTGCTLGWAASLSWATQIRERWEGPDQAMVDLLDRAAQFVRASYASCSAFNPAWPDAEAKAGWLIQWRDILRARPNSTTRRQLSQALQNSINLGDELKRQRYLYQGTEHETNLPTCAEKYFKLGYVLSYVQHHFQLADEAIRLGRGNWPAIAANGQAWLAMMLTQLTEYSQVRTGPCIDLTDKNLPQRISALQQITVHPDNIVAVMGLVDALWSDIDQAISSRCTAANAGNTPRPNQPGVPVNQASARHFVGRFNLGDPSRSFSEYHGSLTLSADGTFTSEEEGTSIVRNTSGGSGTWAFDGGTVTFTIQWNGGGRFTGAVSGNTNDFTIAGYWSNRTAGRLRIHR